MAAVTTLSATVKGGFFAQYGTTLAQIYAGSGAARRQVRYLLSRRGTLALAKAAVTLNGAVAGTTATKTVTRVENNVELGGKRTIETVTLVGTATVAGDITRTNADLFVSDYGGYDNTPIVNGDGNPLGVAH